jgi:hypothetical protein
MAYGAWQLGLRVDTYVSEGAKRKRFTTYGRTSRITRLFVEIIFKTQK